MVSDGALRGTLELAPIGTSERIDEIHKLVDAGILKAVSVGFTPLEYEERKGDEFGFVYTKQELVECSLVSVPANPNALQIVKALNISADTQDLVFAKNKRKIGRTLEERRAIIARARAVLERGSDPAHRGTTKEQARAITAAARALLARGSNNPPLYSKYEIRAINERARAALERAKREGWKPK